MKSISHFAVTGLIAATLAFVAVFAFTPAVHAQSDEDDTSSSSSVQEMLALIESLLEQIEDLQQRLNEVRGEVRDIIQNDLDQGMTGEEVEELQELLASHPGIYPEGLVTGYYGPLTTAAVRRFQEAFGLEAVGRVGPQTRALLNKAAKNNRGSGSGLRNVTLDADDVDDDDIDLSEYTPGVTGVILCHMPPGNAAAQKTIAVGGPAVQAHLRHGDELGRCEDEKIRDDDDEDEDEDDEDEDEEEEEEEDFEVEVEVEGGETTVSFTFDGDDYEVTVESTDEDDVLDAVADELGTTTENLNEDLADEIREELEDAIEEAEEDENYNVASVVVDNGETTVEFTYDGDEEDVEVESTDIDDVLEEIADEVNEDVEDLNEDFVEDVEDALEEAIEEAEAVFDVSVQVDNGTTTVEWTLDGTDYEIDVNSTDVNDVLDAVADEVGTTQVGLDEELKSAIIRELEDELDE